MPCRKLMHDDVVIRIHCLPEEIPVRGNACCSGDEEFDRSVEDAIISRLNQDDDWAWTTVSVVAEWEGICDETYLGCCSYDNEEDFRNNSGYFQDMVDEVLSSMNERVHRLYERLSI